MAIATHNALLHHQKEMQMVGHDDIVTHLDHWVMLMDAFQQFFLNHSAYGCKHNTGCIGSTFGGNRIADDNAQRLSEFINHMQGDVVDARQRVVMSYGAARQAMMCYLVDHVFFTIDKTLR